MTQRDLNRAVASATGETVDTIERMGFGPLTEADEPDPRMMDWDEEDDSRLVMNGVRRRRLSAVA
jgi:hypothetical protein